MSAAKKTLSPFESMKKIGTRATAGVDQEQTTNLGRPILYTSKSRDPEWRAWTGYLKTDTVNDSSYLLKKTKDKRNMSELMQELLAGWLADQKEGKA